ncbi:MAG: putative amino-acid transrane lipoprotein transporter [Subtercola sp.]|nr:putative amino-acid transrane lipoprotein transporter [Subtercola sp.]
MQQVLNGVVLWSIYSIFALGLGLAWGSLKLLNLAQGAIFVFSGFVAYLVSQAVALPFWMLLLISLVVGGLISVLLDAILFRPIKSHTKSENERELLMMIGSIGGGAAIATIVGNSTLGIPFGLSGASQLPNGSIQIAGVTLSVAQASLIIAGVVISGLLWYWVHGTQGGRALRAIAADEEISHLMGINANRQSMVTLFVSGALAGVGSLLLMNYTGALSSDSGDSLMLKAFAIVILGGIGSIPGVILGAAILAGSETLVVVFGSGQWVDAASFVFIMIFILFRPQGIFASGKVDRV